MELNQRKQQFLANRLSANIINHNTSRDTYDSLRDWLIDHRDEFKIPHNRKQIQALSFLGFGLCECCNNLMNIDDIVLERNTKWYESLYGGWNIYDIDTDEQIIRYPESGVIATCYTCEEMNKIKEQKKWLKKILKKSTCKDEDICCSICIDNIEINKQQIKLRCSHRFHPDCISQWTTRKTSCPCCRKEILRAIYFTDIIYL